MSVTDYDERNHDDYCEAVDDHQIPCGCADRYNEIITEIEWTDVAADDGWAA